MHGHVRTFCTVVYSPSILPTDGTSKEGTTKGVPLSSLPEKSGRLNYSSNKVGSFENYRVKISPSNIRNRNGQSYKRGNTLCGRPATMYIHVQHVTKSGTSKCLGRRLDPKHLFWECVPHHSPPLNRLTSCLGRKGQVAILEIVRSDVTQT